MNKVLVDPAALEEAAKWLEVHSSSSGSAEAFAAEALREAIAQPAEAEGGTGNSRGPDAFEVARHSKRLVEQLRAELSAVTAERDRLQQFEAAYNEWHDKTEWVQKTAEAHELGKHRADVLKDRVDQLQAEVERLRNELAGKPLVC